MARFSPSLAILLAAGSLMARPEDEQDEKLANFIQLLNTPVISATRTRERYWTAPAVMEVIEDREIQLKGYRSLLDILRDQPGWDFEMTFGGRVGAYPRLRGVRSLRQVLVILDGVVQNNLNDSEMGRFQSIPLHTIQRVEIITGPASAMYGANALLGVINLVSKTPEQLDGIQGRLGLLTDAGRESFSFWEKELQLSGAHTWDNGLSFSGGFSYTRGNDRGLDGYDPEGMFRRGYVHGGKAIVDEGYRNDKNDKVMTARLSGSNWTLGGDVSNLDEGQGAFYHGGWYFNNHPGMACTWHTLKHSFFASAEYEPTPRLKLQPRLFYRRDETLPDTGYAWAVDRPVSGILFPAGTFVSFRQLAWRAGADLLADYRPSDRLSLLAGLVFERTRTENEESAYITMPPDKIPANKVFHLNLWSVYFQAYGNLTPELKLLAGGRYDRDDNETQSNFSPRVGLVYSPSDALLEGDQMVLKFLYGHAFRSLPIYQKYNYGSNALIPEIRPEKIRTTEMELQWLPNRAWKFQLSAWHNQIRDFYIDGTNAYSSKMIVNGSPSSDFVDVKTYGGLAGVQIRVGRWNGMFQFHRTEGRNHDLYYDLDADGNYGNRFEELTRISKNKFYFSVGYQIHDRFSLEVRARRMGERQAPPNDLRFGSGQVYTYLDPQGQSHSVVGSGTLPGYTQVDAVLNLWKLIGNRRWMLTLGLSNLLNEQYLEFTRTELARAPRYQPQPGRRVYLALKLQ